MISLSPIERKALKARAHHLDAVVMIGDAGLTPSVLKEIDVALKSHELIKVRVLGDDRELRQTIATEVVSALDAGLVQHIGKLLVFFRPAPPESVKPAKPRRPSGPRRTKKQLGSTEPKPTRGTRR
jgi:putative YhbY family RNA-binding protein